MYDLFSLVPAQVYYYKMKWEKKKENEKKL